MATTHAKPAQAVNVRGKVRKGKLMLTAPLNIPDGDVEVTVVRGKKNAVRAGFSLEELLAHPAFGMWKNREDMKDPHDYARKIRARFNKEFGGERLRRRFDRVD
jgi:hypothetical protein